MKSQNNKKQEKTLTINSGLRAGFWIAFGAGVGDLQIVPRGETISQESPIATPRAATLPVSSNK